MFTADTPYNVQVCTQKQHTLVQMSSQSPSHLTSNQVLYSVAYKSHMCLLSSFRPEVGENVTGAPPSDVTRHARAYISNDMNPDNVFTGGIQTLCVI